MPLNCSTEIRIFADICKHHLLNMPVLSDEFKSEAWVHEMIEDWKIKHSLICWNEKNIATIYGSESPPVLSIESHLKQRKPSLSEASVAAYATRLRKIASLCGCEFTPGFLIQRREDINKWLGAQYKTVNRRSYYTAIVAYLDDENYESIHEGLRTEITKVDQTAAKSPKMEKNWITLEEIETVKQSVDLQGKALISLYEECPLRNDVAEMEVISLCDYSEKIKFGNVNFYVKRPNGTAFLHLEKYKTKNAYGVKTIELVGKTIACVDMWLAISPNPQYLFLNSRNGPVSRNGLTKLFNRYFKNTGKCVSTTIFRHVVVSSIVDPVPITDERVELAHKMGHSIAQQQLYAKF